MTGLERELMELVREALPKAIEEGDAARVEVLERRLAQGGMACPNPVTTLWNGPLDIPRNEAQVREMYATRMADYGYRVAASQERFPDWCLQNLETGEFLLAEVEHKSSSFFTHDHDQASCDMVVCWEHNAPGICLPVLELFSGKVHEPNVPIAQPNEEAKLRAFGDYANARYVKRQQLKLTGKHRDPLESARLLCSLVDDAVADGRRKTDAVRDVADQMNMGRSTVWAVIKKRDEFGI
jgi:hypothetical protein